MLLTAKNFTAHKILCALLCIMLSACAATPTPDLEVKPQPAKNPTDALRAALADYMVCFRLELMGFEKQEPALSSKVFCLTEVYPEKNLSPYWVTPDGPGERASIVVGFLKNAEAEGLDSANYEVKVISSLFAERDPESLAMLEILLTFNLIKYIHDVSSGRIKQLYAAPGLFPDATSLRFNPRSTMKKILGTPDLAAYLASLPPAHRHYRGLKKALAQYRAIENEGGWPSIPKGPTINPGDNDTRVPVLIRRLYATNDLDLTTPLTPLTTSYGPALKEAINRFQQRHGLDPDGTIGPDTFAALNVSVVGRIKQIIVNMTRWRWQQHDLGEKYIIVNIAHFDLTAFDAGHFIFAMPVIVGKFLNQTPIFSDRISTVEINPYWNIPESIARNEELPELKKDPKYLVDRHVRVFSGWEDDTTEIDSTAVDWSTISPEMMNEYRLRQDPGPWNALGQIKFVFPNKYSVYLHDTPTQSLFSRSKRDFSHGCIRVSDPVKLAAFTLSGQKDKNWTPELINKSIKEKERMIIGLVEKLPIHITYQTAWFDKQGIVCFNYDVYGRDKKLLKALFGE